MLKYLAGVMMTSALLGIFEPIPSALGQEVTVQNWRPTSPGDAQLLGVHSTTYNKPGTPSFGVAFSLLDDPLVVVDDNDDRVGALVDRQIAVELGFAWGIGQLLEVGATLPTIANQRSADFMTAADGSEAGIGDVGVMGRLRLLKTSSGLNWALRTELSLPTANIAYAGRSGPVFSPTVIADWRGENLLLAGNLGGKLTGSSEVGDLTVGSAMTYGIGGGFSLGHLPIALLGELAGELAGSSAAQNPLELRGGIRVKTKTGINFMVGYGRGLNSGYGAPDHRLLLDVTYGQPEKPAPRMVYRMKEGVIVAIPENPDPDGDGITDNDKCPDEPEDVDGYQDEDGCPEEDNDNDKILDSKDGCPINPEDMDGFQDEDGCPEPDNDFDGILDQDDKCPTKQEIINGVEDNDGCPDVGKRLVVVGAAKIEIREKLFFANNKDLILPRSELVLEQLAKTIQRMPWLKKIRIEGHTDDVGDALANKDLSQRRADSVKRALIERGVSTDKLEAIGYGEEQPIDRNITLNGRANNRRVEFVILQQDAPPAGWKPPTDAVLETEPGKEKP